MGSIQGTAKVKGEPLKKIKRKKSKEESVSSENKISKVKE